MPYEDSFESLRVVRKIVGASNLFDGNAKEELFPHASWLVQCYMTARRRHRGTDHSPIELLIVQDEKGKTVDYGHPSDWDMGTASRVRGGSWSIHRIWYYRDVPVMASLPSTPHTKTPIAPSLSLTKKYPLKYLNWTDKDTMFMDRLVHGMFCARGQRSSMEDTHTLIKNYDECVLDFYRLFKTTGERVEDFFLEDHSTQAFFGVFDGHGGREAAEYCEEHLFDNVASELARSLVNRNGQRFVRRDDSVSAGIHGGMRLTEEAFLDMAMDEGIFSGAVVVFAIISGLDLYVAHAGDARAILCRGGQAITLTIDHDCDNEEEKERVQRDGGVFDYGYLNGNLAVTRAMGDVDMDTGRKQAGMSARVDVRKIPLTPEDEFLILACDGLWDVLSPEGAVKLARDSLLEMNDVTIASQFLVNEALKRSEDNISVVIVGFPKPDEHDQMKVVCGDHKHIRPGSNKHGPRTPHNSSSNKSTGGQLQNMGSLQLPSPQISQSPSPIVLSPELGNRKHLTNI